MEYPVYDMTYITDRVVVDGNGCWIWQLARNEQGYGVGAFNIDGRRRRSAHRISFYLYNGYLPDEYCCHTCDVPSCCNPLHLYNGTATTNANDRESRNRGYKPSGVLSPTNKLSEDQVREIRELHSTGTYTYYKLARMYPVNQSAIRNIVLRITWDHLD